MAPVDELPSPDLPPPAEGAVGPGISPPLLANRVPVPPSASSSPYTQRSDHALTASEATPKWLEATLVLLVSAVAFLLASFPARNSDLWMHLANGRLLAQGEYLFGTELRLPSGSQANHAWLYDLLNYGLYSAFAGPGLVVCKALLVVAIALLLLRLSRAGQEWWLPVFCTALALLAMSMRLLLQPATVSYLFMALTLWFLRDRGEIPANRPSRLLSQWPLFVLFVIWVNMDGWFVLGLGTVALVWLGEVLNSATRKETSGQGEAGLVALSLRHLVSFSLLAAVCLLNPYGFRAFAPPDDLWWFGSSASSASHSAADKVWSPFQPAFFVTAIGLNPAGLAYFPLLGLGLLSFALNLPRWHWQRFLPWLGLALLSAFQVRTVPFFAIVAGPVLAWNLQELIAQLTITGQWHRPVWQRSLTLARVFTVVLILVLSVCAWPGWLQTPPFEPRRWAVETPPSLEKGAATTRVWLKEGKLGPEARGLHLSPETAYAFAWYCREEKGLRDDRLAKAIRGDSEAPVDWDERMRSMGINHVIVYDTDPGRLCATMDRLLEDPQQWPLLYVEGYLSVFGWRDPTAAGATDPFQGRQLDLNHLAFHPAQDKKAPRTTTQRTPEAREWWEAFWNPVLPRPIDQDEATLHLIHANALLQTAPFRHEGAWEASQSAALLGAASGWTGPAGGLSDAYLRLTLLRPQTPAEGSRFDTLPAPDQMAHALQQGFTLQRDDTSPALLYLAVRAARRALAVNPADAQAYLVLGESYLRLLHDTRERAWSEHLPELVQLRRAQASAALNQAVSLKPDFPQARLNLSRLYGEMGYVDLTLAHLRAYVKLFHEAGPPPGISTEQFREQIAQYDEALSQLTKEVEKRDNSFEVASAGWKVGDRAFKAFRMGLAGKARDLLLESNIAAFGPQGMAMELELLLRTGRPKDVFKWTSELSAEENAVLGAQPYHWLRVQALAASGDYALAQEECNQMARSVASSLHGQEPGRFREIMALLVGRRVLAEQSGGGTLPDLIRLSADRFEFRNRIEGLAQTLRREADVTVLRGLLALEEGEIDEAEIAFRSALSYWKDEAAAASGGGLEFKGRVVAQGCLEWLE